MTSIALFKYSQLTRQSSACILNLAKQQTQRPIITKSLISQINNRMKNYPLITATSIAVVKTGLADFMIQKYVENKRFNEINWKRNFCFAAFGFLYMGAALNQLYSKIYPHIFKVLLKLPQKRIPAAKFMFDSFIHSPFIYFPTFYCIKGMVFKESISSKVIYDSLHEYFCINFKSDMMNFYKLWIPAQMITFGVLPIHLQVPWVALISFIWTAYLSYSRGKE